MIYSNFINTVEFIYRIYYKKGKKIYSLDPELRSYSLQKDRR